MIKDFFFYLYFNQLACLKDRLFHNRYTPLSGLIIYFFQSLIFSHVLNFFNPGKPALNSCWKTIHPLWKASQALFHNHQSLPWNTAFFPFRNNHDSLFKETREQKNGVTRDRLYWSDSAESVWVKISTNSMDRI